MSEKRTSAEPSNDEQNNESLYAVFQQEDGSKRGSLCDTSLHDLPREMLQYILVKAVALEVKDTKLAKSVWKEKADPVISRLSDVCPQWSSVLSTSFFRNELHRVLDGIAEETIRLDVLHQSPIHAFALRITALSDEILIFCGVVGEDNVINVSTLAIKILVYDRNDMSEVKDVITLPPQMRAWHFAGSNVSNCVYLTVENTELNCFSILRIARNEEHQFNMHPWISDLEWSISYITVSVEGNVIIISNPKGLNSTAISIFSPNSFKLHEVLLSPDIYGFACIRSVIKKSNGNLVFTAYCEPYGTVLTEIDAGGAIQHQYKYTQGGRTCVSLADGSGRILLHDREYGKWKMLDAELNLLDFAGPQPNQHGGDFNDLSGFHYNSDRNEIVGLDSIDDFNSVITIFRLSEE